MNRSQQSRSAGAIDFSHQLRHYLNLVWRKKKQIIITGPLIALAAAIVIWNISSRDPELPATVLIGIENTADMTAVRDVGGLVQSQSDLIQSRTFLEEIAMRLSLRFFLNKYPRAAIFDTLAADSTSTAGKYRVQIDKKDNAIFRLYFSDSKLGGFPGLNSLLASPQKMYEGSLAGTSEVRLGGMHLVFSKNFIDHPHDFAFRIVDIRAAVEDLFPRISVKAADPIRGSFNIAVSVRGYDYKLCADIANTIGDAFVQKNVNFRKGRSKSVLASLEKQLETVKLDLSSSDDMLRSFRAANPTVGLSEDIKLRVSSLSQMQTGVFDAQRSVSDAQELGARYESASGDDKVRVANEILGFLGGRHVNSASGFTAELGQLVEDQRDLRRNYVNDHPLRLQNDKKIADLENEIGTVLKGYVASMQGSLTNKTADIQSLSGELRQLPSKELELAELQRRQQIASDIYSTVLSRYNQAKVANSAEAAEAFIMDPAVPPLPPLVKTGKLLILAALVGLLFTFGPVLFFDYLDKTVRTDFDFRQKAGKTFFELVPKIPSISKDAIKESRTGKAPAPGAVSLVTEYLPNTYVHEIFRVLRTKVLLKLDGMDRKVLCVTSMESGVGKSTISANIASTIAQQGMATVLIDADLRLGQLYKTFGCKKNPGLSQMLSLSQTSNGHSFEEFVQPTSIPNLSFVSGGDASHSSSEMLSSEKFAAFEDYLAKRFAVLIIDAPPLGPVTDAAVIAPLVSQYLVVVKADMTDVHDLIKKISEFPYVEQRLMGYVLNYATEKRAISYYKRSKYIS
jgi:capsular exopolysaccharide synthesis family protein